MEKGEVLVNNEREHPGENTLNLLIHIARNVGNFSQRSEIFKAVWGFDSDNDDPWCTRNLQKALSSYVYRYGGGILKGHIKGIRGGYLFKESLRSCLIAEKLVPPI